MSQSSHYDLPGGPRLAAFLDGLPVLTRWRSGYHIVWQTGQQNVFQSGGPAAETHCSAFAAAVGLMLDIYVLRPPDHGQEFLADAQADWLRGVGTTPGPTAEDSGWLPLGTGSDGGVPAAAAAAGAGQLVLAIYHAPPVTDPNGTVEQKSGHVCIVRPQPPGWQEATPLNVMSVGEESWTSVSIKVAFQDHPAAWPARVYFYAHDTDLAQDYAAES